MAFVPNTDKERAEMLQSIGVSSFDELIADIPQELRLNKALNLDSALSELEAVKLLEKYASLNANSHDYACFIGAGAYDHYSPEIINTISSRSEFKTAYTPYQAEVSQGTLQVMYEYQSMVCALTGMDITNASLYDGGSGLAEAALMAASHTNRKKILIAGKIHPNYKEVLETIGFGRDLIIEEYASNDGSADLTALKEAVCDSTAAVIVQQPNFYGFLEEVEEIEKIAHAKKALFIVTVDIMSLPLIKAPSEYNADIVVAEGQPLGIPLSFGGPYLGVFSCKKELVRKLPGRICGMTQDQDGKRGFVLTLQTREQQIKREKATSNICSNQGLYMLCATVYLATMGKSGLKEVTEQSFQKAHYFAKKLSEISGYSLISAKPFFREILVKTPVAPKLILDEAVKSNILGGFDTSKFKGCEEGILIAFTEKRTKEEMDAYLDILKKFAK